MFRFPSIEQFRTVVRHVHQQARYMGLDSEGNAIMNPAPKFPTLTFKGTVKLHGTNAAIVLSPQGINYQSRERVLTLETDNAGFMNHMVSHEPAVLNMFSTVIAGIDNHDYTKDIIAVYGEWCGGNIQTGVAINGLAKMFVVFGVSVNGIWLPGAVTQIDEASANIKNVDMFSTWIINIDFSKPEVAQNEMVLITSQVENECPVGKYFDKRGIGEGVVWHCVENPSHELWFKVKGEKHSVSKVKTFNAVDVEVLANIEDLIGKTVTEPRLEQGLQVLTREMLKPINMASMGDFIRWVVGDVLREEADVIKESALDVKQVSKAITTKARIWFVEQLDKEMSL